MPNKLFGDVLHREIGFLDHRNIDYKKSQNLHFSKGSMVFLKNCNLSHFFFLFKKWRTKEVNDVLYRKIGFSRLTSHNIAFFQSC